MGDLLKDKVAIISGGCRGIGREYALGFVDQGAKVVIPDTVLENAESVVKGIEAKGGEAIALHADISDEDTTKMVADRTFEQFGKIDILVNNAAIYANIGFRPWDSLSAEEWDRIFAVNVKGTWLMCKAVVPFMMKEGKGKIINIGSNTSGAPKGAEALFHYASTKGAIIVMTRLLARALGDSQINVNCITPGFTLTEASLTQANQHPGGLAPRAVMGQCLGRSEQPEDLVGTAIYLASHLSDFVTGQLIPVDGGAWLR